MRQITFPPTFEGWRTAARAALASDAEPGALFWEELQAGEPPLPMFDEHEAPVSAGHAHVPRGFVELARRVSCHRDGRRWALLYATLWRLTHGEPHLLEIVTDPTVYELQRMDKSVRHDVHKMRAFVRFREVSHEGSTWYVAWFEPEHHIVEWNAPFFRDRFASMRWSILTPDRCVHWDGSQLSFTSGVPKSEAPTEDQTETLWLKYYASIFNPARVKVHAMQAEMPKKYWKNLPEAALIPMLLNEAPARVGEMIRKSRKTESAQSHPAPVTEGASLTQLREAAGHCRACPLYAKATQVVFGEGPENSKLVFVGEQPGDNEDTEGHPFVGPAGKLFDRALEDAGIDRNEVYVTNAVKHFKWVPSGKRRMHDTPNGSEIVACRPWLEAELRIIKPRVLVLLGGTAAKSLLGSKVRVLRDRGSPMPSKYCEQTLITVHPSSLLRTPDEASREAGYADFVRDLKTAMKLLAHYGK